MLCAGSVASFSAGWTRVISPNRSFRLTARASMAADESYDRQAEVRTFDETKKGVKGLVDQGIASIPRIFIHPIEARSEPARDDVLIPTIDLAGVNSSPARRKQAAEEIARASREIGFFQIVNHGAPIEAIDRVIDSVKAFHELPEEFKMPLYERGEKGFGVNFVSNVDLYKSKAATWRDTIQIVVGPRMAQVEERIPEICRKEVMEWAEHGTRVCELVMELICEGIGLPAARLKDMSCSEGKQMVGHYYPWCPQPDLTNGLSSHTDPGVLTVLLQDHIGGLQVKCSGNWAIVKPVRGAIVINVGDMLQMMTNDECISVEHKVVANGGHEPRVSVAIFFIPGQRERVLEPFPELVSPEKPPIYRPFTTSEYMKSFLNKQIGDKTLREQYKV